MPKSRPHITSNLFLAMPMVALLLGTPSVAHAQTDTTDTVVGQPEAIQAVINHPTVASARAEVCSAASRFDRARSRQFPQVSANLSGASSLSSNVDTLETQSRRIEDNDIDAVISLRQTLFDWGLTKSEKQVALSNKASSRIAAMIAVDRVAADIVDLSITVAEHRERLSLITAYIAELQPLIERIEASVNAGVLRIGDLRTAKVVELDAEVSRSLAERQLELVESELTTRFGITIEQADVLLSRFLANRPEAAVITESDLTREVQRLDHDIKSNQFSLDGIKAERYPSLETSLDLTLFNFDSYSNEYELVGTMRVAMPLYDGGGNKARRSETEWLKRGLESQRTNALRQHRNVSLATGQNIERTRETFKANTIKMIELGTRLDEAKARQGQTVNDPITIIRGIEQLTDIESEQIALRFDIELGLLQALFYADRLGEILEIPYGGEQC